MLMDSHGDRIDLLPALPKAWPTGNVTGLRARGRCTVDLHWRDGRLEHAILRPELGGARKIRLGSAERNLTLQAGKPVRLTFKDFT